MSSFYANLFEDNELHSHVSSFFTDQVFNTHEDLKTWAQNKARPLGYVIITKRSKANSGGFMNEVDLMCDLSGQYKENESSKLTATRKTNCPFLLVGKYSWVFNGWTLSVICDEHNHPPAEHMEAHPYARRLTPHEYRLVEDLTRKNVAARNILAIIKELIKRERLRIQIPKVFHPYISTSSLQDVQPDGNCGFRSVALGLGLHEDDWPRIRSDLVHELESRQRQYMCIFGTVGYNTIYSTVRFAGQWMEMPNTGLVIASAYNKVVVNLADGGCTTSFPLWPSPPQSDSHEIIVIAHVNGDHYIRVALRECFPLPITHPLWITYKSDAASRWEDKFVSRQNDFREFYYRVPQHYDLT